MFIIFSTAVAEPPSKRAQPLEQKKEQQNITHFYQSRYLWGRFFLLKKKASIYLSCDIYTGALLKPCPWELHSTKLTMKKTTC